jgi:hypothetical protein
MTDLKKEIERDNACEKHKGNWHLDCPKCYSNYCKMIDNLPKELK